MTYLKKKKLRKNIAIFVLNDGFINFAEFIRAHKMWSNMYVKALKPAERPAEWWGEVCWQCILFMQLA